MRIAPAVCLLVPALLAGVPATTADRQLFNGRNLEGWTAYVDPQALAIDPSLKTEQVFQARPGGVLAVAGAPSGMMSTLEQFQDFRLRLEFRWGLVGPDAQSARLAFPEAARNRRFSGLLLRTQRDPSDGRLSTYEVEIANTTASPAATGDFYLGGPAYNGKGFHTVPPRLRAGFGGRGWQVAARNENAPGAWNLLEVLADGDRLVVRLNGKVVNEGFGAERTAGAIGLQSEGWPIEFRNIRLTPVSH
jgi:hypothetical protein